MKLAYSLKDAAADTPYSVDYLRRAIKTTNVDPAKGVHHLPAKQDRNGKYVIEGEALAAWIGQLDDA